MHASCSTAYSTAQSPLTGAHARSSWPPWWSRVSSSALGSPKRRSTHAGDNSALRARILLIVADNQIAFKDFATAEETTEKARAIAENLGDPVLLAAALDGAAFLNEHLGRSAQSLLERAVTVLGTRAPLPGFHTPRNMLGQFKLMRGDIAGAASCSRLTSRRPAAGGRTSSRSARSAGCSISNTPQGGGRTPTATSTSKHNSRSTATIPSARASCTGGRRCWQLVRAAKTRRDASRTKRLRSARSARLRSPARLAACSDSSPSPSTSRRTPARRCGSSSTFPGPTPIPSPSTSGCQWRRMRSRRW